MGTDGQAGLAVPLAVAILAYWQTGSAAATGTLAPGQSATGSASGTSSGTSSGTHQAASAAATASVAGPLAGADARAGRADSSGGRLAAESGGGLGLIGTGPCPGLRDRGNTIIP